MNKTTKWYVKPLYALIALALVAGLTLVPVMVPTLAPVAGPTVEASSVSSVKVNVSVTTPAGNATYIINFTTNVALTPTATDTITIEFPIGTTANTLISGLSTTYAHVGNSTANASAVTTVSIGARRLSLKPSTVVYAGHVTVILNGTLITNPNPEGNYTLTVYTTQETTPVTSSSYIIDSIVTACTVNNTRNQTVNTSTLWNIRVTPATAMIANSDKFTIIFPPTTTVPTSITATSNVSINGTSLDYVTDYVVSGQNLTITVPANLNTTPQYINVTLLTGLRNPTDIRTNWTVQIFTTKDRGINTSGTFCTSAGGMGAISYLNWSGWDTYVHNNTNSSATFKIVAKDVFGNNATVNASTTLALGADGGTFYDTNYAAVGTIAIANNACATAVLYYKNKVPGDKTVTASEVVTQGWTAASKSVTVSPNVQLWGGGSIVGNYSTITLAEAAAVPYDTIKVLPGTYKPSAAITIDVDYLTLESTGGASQTIINATNVGVGLGGAGFYIHNAKGVVVDGFTIANPPACGIFLYEADNATIKNNIVLNSTAEITGIDVSWVATGVTVSGNELNEWAVMTVHGSNCTVSGNTFNRCLVFWPQPGQTQDKVRITDNTIAGNVPNTGITIMEFGTQSVVNNSVIKNNTIANHDNGIAIWSNAADKLIVRNLTITGNTITDNINGINISALIAGGHNITIKNNNIYDNTNYGINNTNSTSTIPATLNYWGNATGPSSGSGAYASSAIGSGDKVTKNVTYSPWLNAAYPGGQSTTGVNLTLTAGWNFISVPKKLENATFGWLLSGQSISQSYGYDPSTGWTLLNGSSPVEVLAGYWVSANAAGTMRLIFVSTGQGVPASKDLTGNKWNSIGFSNTTATTASLTLQSVNSTWSNALGWNATNQIYDAAIIWPGSGAANNMNPGKGYWLWMTANDTLAALSA